MTTPAEIVNATMDRCWAQGSTFASAFAAKSSNAVASLGDYAAEHDPLAPQVITKPVVLEPTVDIPASVTADDVVNYFMANYPTIMNDLAQRFADFITTYFADDAAFTAARTWLADAITNPEDNPPLPTAVANQIWEDDRARIRDDATARIAEVTTAWAAKRFPLPPGAAANQVLRIQQSAQSELAKSSRAVAAKSADMAYDKIKFAVEKALDLKKLAIMAAGDYIKALTSGLDVSSRMTGMGYDAQSKLIGAASQFYAARADVAKIGVDVDKSNINADIERDKVKRQSGIARMDSKVKLLLADAQVTAQVATSLYNNMHVQASVSASSQNGVNYSYKNDTTSKPASVTVAP